MYANLDRFQKYITDLIDENKKLSKKINKYSNSENNSQIKEMEKNEEIFERLNKKFMNLQNE